MTQDGVERIAERKAEQSPQMAESEKGQVTQANGMPGPTSRQSRAVKPSVQEERLQHAKRRSDRLQQTTELCGRGSGMKTAQPPADATLQVPKDDERRRREARHLPDEEKLELAMGRQQ